MGRLSKSLLVTINTLATVQFVWCYLWLTRPYVNTELYSLGRERNAVSGQVDDDAGDVVGAPELGAGVAGEAVWALALLVSQGRSARGAGAGGGRRAVRGRGWGGGTVRIYQASSGRGVLTPFVYPLFLCVCAATYVMHTVQNFRFIYDLPSLAFFSVAMYLLYFRRHWGWFAALFLVATVNRETTLLLLPLFVINEGFDGFKFQWSRAFRVRVVGIVVALGAAWAGWQVLVRHVFAHNASEFYPRFNWNLKSMLAPLAWPQMLSACGYLLLVVCLLRKQIPDSRLQTWLWIVPIWLGFMFTFGILIETRVFGELIPLVVCSTCLIAEEMIVARLREGAGGGKRDGNESTC